MTASPEKILVTGFGPRQRPDLAIFKFTRQIMAGQPIDQYGDGSTARDYTFVEDIVSGVMAAGRYTASDFEIINLGGSAVSQWFPMMNSRPFRLSYALKSE